MSSNPESSRIFGLDLMRASALMLVMSSHTLWIYPPNDSVFTYFFRLVGFLGVEMFFVLSGFLIGTIFYKLYIQDGFTFKEVLYFLKRRWFRTLPNYYLYLILNVIVAIIIGYSYADIWKYIFFIQNFASQMPAIYPEAWSLSVEEYTYLILPFSVYFVTIFLKPKNKKYTFLTIIILLILVFILTKWFYNITTTNISLNQWNVSLKNVVIYRIDAILYGVLISWLMINCNDFMIKYKNYFVFFALFLLFIVNIVLGFFGVTIENNPTFWNVFYLPISSITMSFFLPFLSQWKNTKLPFKRIIVFLSLISYSFYLIHYSIVMQLMKHFIKTDYFQLYEYHLFTLCFLIISLSLSYLNYKYFEKPMMNLRDKF